MLVGFLWLVFFFVVVCFVRFFFFLPFCSPVSSLSISLGRTGAFLVYQSQALWVSATA